MYRTQQLQVQVHALRVHAQAAGAASPPRPGACSASRIWALRNGRRAAGASARVSAAGAVQPCSACGRVEVVRQASVVEGAVVGVCGRCAGERQGGEVG